MHSDQSEASYSTDGARRMWAGEYPVLPASALIARTHTRPLIDLLRIKLGVPEAFHVSAVVPVIEAYAAFVQLLPARESARHARPSGRLAYGLERALRAVDRRRGYILPPGASSEVIGEHAHRWTYAVFVAALIDTAHATCGGLRVLMRVPAQGSEVWDPAGVSMLAAGASTYRIEVLEHVAVPSVRIDGFAMRRFEDWVPAPVRAWLDQDATVLPALQAGCCAAPGARQGVLAELLQDARPPRDRTDATDARRDASVSEREPPAPSGVPSRVEPAGDVDNSARSGAPATASNAKARGEGTAPAREFMAWLQSGLSDGTLRVNEPGALVHGVEEGLLLVSPQIFRRFVAQGGVGFDGGSSPRPDGVAKRIQREVFRAGWHVQRPGGVNICTYQVTQGARNGARLSGVVIRDPKRFIDPVPARSVGLVSIPESSPRD